MTSSFRAWREVRQRGREPSVFLCQWCMASLLSMTVILDRYRERERNRSRKRGGERESLLSSLEEPSAVFFVSCVWRV